MKPCTRWVDGKVCGQEPCATVHMVESGHDYVSRTSTSRSTMGRTEAPTAWGYRGYVARAHRADPPAWDAMLAHWIEQTTAEAAEQGITLTGEPEIVSEQETVYVEDWSEHGGEWVRPDVARAAGLDPDILRPGPTVVLLRWPL